MSTVIPPPAPSIKNFVNDVKNLMLEVAERASAVFASAFFQSDTFKDATGINSGTSTGYTHRGASNYDVIKASGGIKQSETTQHSSWDFWRAGLGYSKGAGVVFQAGSSFTASSVDFYIGKTGSPTGNLKAKLYALNSQALTAIPSGAALAESASFDVSTLSGSQGWVNFTFTTPYSLVSGTWYGVVLEASGAVGDNSNKIAFGESTSNTASFNGLNANDSLTWTNIGAEAAMFRIYEQDPAQADIRSVTLTTPSAVTQVVMCADVTLNTGTAAYYVSTDGGSTWTSVSLENLKKIITVPSGTQLVARVVLTGNAELEFLSIAGANQ